MLPPGERYIWAMTTDGPDTARRRIAVVVNPTRADLAEELLAALADADSRAHVEAIEVEDPSHLADAVSQAAADGATVVAAVGGDGTQRTAATALQGTDCALAVVPGGTVNLLGQVLGITDVAISVRAMLGGRTRALDLGTLDGEPFVLMAGTGFDAAVMHAVDDEAKRFGRLGYVMAGMRAMREDRPRAVAVTVDGDRLFTGRAMSVIVANIGQRASAEFTMVPAAEPDDGRIDVLVQRCDTPVSITRALVALARGQRPRSDDVVMGQGREIEVRWRGQVWSQRDGDAIRMGTTFRHGVLPGVLHVCVPPDDPAAAPED